MQVKIARTLLLAALAAAGLQPEAGAGGAQTEQKFEQLSAFVRKTMAETAVPGVAVGVLVDGRRYTAGFGVTSVENPLQVTDRTLFQIGSITKTFTGTLIMRLVEDGRLSLDAPVRDYLPEFRVRDEATSSSVTVRDVLTHMSGWVGDYFNTTGEGDDALAQMMTRMAALDQLAPIRTVWSYNNSAFYVAGRLIEVATGTSYAEALDRLVLKPLDLEAAFIRPADVMTRRFVVGHSISSSGIEVARPWALYRAAWPAGGLTTNVGHLLDYASFHLGDGTNRSGERVLKRDSLEAMQAEQAAKIGSDDAMGITWQLSDVGGVLTVSHGGGTVGQISLLLLVPERDFALAILTNANRGGTVTRKVSRWILENYLNLSDNDPTPRQAGDSELAEYAGLYRRPMADLEVRVDDGRLLIRRIPRQSFPTPDVPVPPPGPPDAYGLYAADRIIEFDGTGRAEFVRRPDGSIGWLRLGGRIHAKQ